MQIKKYLNKLIAHIVINLWKNLLQLYHVVTHFVLNVKLVMIKDNAQNVVQK